MNATPNVPDTSAVSMTDPILLQSIATSVGATENTPQVVVYTSSVAQREPRHCAVVSWTRDWVMVFFLAAPLSLRRKSGLVELPYTGRWPLVHFVRT